MIQHPRLRHSRLGHFVHRQDTAENALTSDRGGQIPLSCSNAVITVTGIYTEPSVLEPF